MAADGKQYAEVFRTVIVLWIEDWCEQFCNCTLDKAKKALIRDVCHAQIMCLDEFSPGTMANLFTRAKAQEGAKSVVDLLKGMK